MMFIVLPLIGLFAGVSSGLFGLGGSIVILPALFLYGYNLREAMGISFFQMFFVIGLSLYLRYRSYGLDTATARLTVPFIAIGAAVGIIISHNIPLMLFQIIFGGVLILLGINMFFPKKKKTNDMSARNKTVAIIMLSIVTGIYSGFFGVGGGTIFTPGLTALGYSITDAISLSLLGVFGVGAVGIVSYTYMWSQHLPESLLLCGGAIAGLLIGHRLSLRDTTKKLTLYGLATLIILSGLIMLIKSL